MNEALFEILRAVVVLVIVLLARYVIPYLKALAESTKYAWVTKWVELSVKSAEQTVFGDKTGPEKKAIVTKFIKEQLLKKNIALSDEQLNTLIESAVFEMNGGKQ